MNSILIFIRSKNQIAIAFFMLLLLFVGACSKYPTEIPMDKHVLFPIGQRSIEIDNFIIEADSLIREYEIVEDQYGGRWVKLAFNKLDLNTTVGIKFKIRSGPLFLNEQIGPVPEMYLKPSEYIDSDHSAIIQKAAQLTNGPWDVKTKARNIQLFVHSYIEFKIFKDCGIVSASETFKNRYGTCINYARLFVALCRSVGIPARSVWGALNSDNGNYKGHHNWAEYLGEDNKWHPVGLSYSNLYDINDPRYLDLLYAPEESIHLEEYKSFTIATNGDYYYYDGSGSPVDGKLGINTYLYNYPDEVILSMHYYIGELFDH